MPEELIKRGLDWLERYWHKKLTAFFAPLIASGSIFLALYFAQSQQIPNTFSLCLVVLVGLVVSVVWFSTNHLPKVRTGNAGIVIAILCDDPAEEKQVKADYVSHLRQLVSQGGGGFQLVELPSWCLENVEDVSKMNQLLHKVRGHFLLYGRVRLRNVDGKPAHILSFEGIVRHRPVPDHVRKELVGDFSKVLPRKVVIEKENDAFKFEATSEWTEASTRYVVGTAALISGDVAYAEELFGQVQMNLNTPSLAASYAGVKEIYRLLPKRYRQLYQAWTIHLCAAYTSTRNKEYLVKCDGIVSKLLHYEPANPHGLLIKAICEFVLRRNVPAAHELVTKSKSETDATWLYSRAFLHAYQGKMREAQADYRKAFNGKTNSPATPNDCEEFINIILNEEPDKIQLYMCLGLINFYVKQDFVAAQKDLNRFIAEVTDARFPRQVNEAKKLLLECQKQTQPGTVAAIALNPSKIQTMPSVA